MASWHHNLTTETWKKSRNVERDSFFTLGYKYMNVNNNMVHWYGLKLLMFIIKHNFLNHCDLQLKYFQHFSIFYLLTIFLVCTHASMPAVHAPYIGLYNSEHVNMEAWELISVVPSICVGKAMCVTSHWTLTLGNTFANILFFPLSDGTASHREITCLLWHTEGTSRKLKYISFTLAPQELWGVRVRTWSINAGRE